ncbi:MAG: hypothetical protein EB165_03615 [Euryarchaeota archaeon]|nr:hypothetical protein [Euryarchaeota archaeon]
MAKVTAIQTNFTGGELSPRLDGRVDITKYKNGCRVIQNMTVLPHGGARKRSGTRFVVEQKNGTDDVALIPFQYNVEQSYMLVFGNSYIWFCKDGGIITHDALSISSIGLFNPCQITTSTAHGLDNGDWIVLSGVGGTIELNNRRVQVQNVTANTFTLVDVDATGYTAYTTGGAVNPIVELATTYTSDEVAEISWAQSNDVLYLAHKDHPLRKVERSSNTLWTLSNVTSTTGPFRTVNSARDFTLTPSNFSTTATGYGTHIVGTTFTLTASEPLFDAGHVGAIFRLSEEGGGTGIQGAPVGTSKSLAVDDVYTANGNVYGVATVSGASNWTNFTRVPEHESGTVRVEYQATYFDADYLHPTYCVIRIDNVLSETVATAALVRYQMPETIVSGGTSFWEEGAWSAYRGYPRAIAFHEGRLWFSGSASDPAVLWSSRSGSYEDFEDGPDDDDAIVYRIVSGAADVVRWLSAGRVLTAGSSVGEFAIAASNQNEALTPDNFKATPQTTYGTSRCLPVRVNQVVLYPQRNGDPDNAAKKLREFAYSFQADAFDSTDLTVFSEHILGPGINRIAYQLEPDSLIWTCRTDGQLACCTYEPSQEVISWHRHVTNGLVKAICAVPGGNGDDVWMSVERTIDGETVRYIEYLLPHFDDDADKSDGIFVDSSLSYSGSETDSINGLWHLRGQSVKINNNGAVEVGVVTSTGVLDLVNATAKAHIGLSYKAILETEDLEEGARAGTAQSRAKRISQIFIRLLNSLGGTYGPDADNQKKFIYRTGGDLHGTSPPLFSGLKEVDFNSGWDRFARVRLENEDPLPFHVTAIVVEINTTG